MAKFKQEVQVDVVLSPQAMETLRGLASFAALAADILGQLLDGLAQLGVTPYANEEFASDGDGSTGDVDDVVGTNDDRNTDNTATSEPRSESVKRFGSEFSR